jgi:hypothetical protein
MGKKLTKSQLNGKKSPSFSTELAWPKQVKPSRKSWDTFSRTLKYIFCHNHSLTLKKNPRPMDTNTLPPKHMEPFF